MGKTDEVRKRFWENNTRFADLINVIFSDGKAEIRSENLQEDTVLTARQKGRSVQRTRDMIWKSSLHANYLLIGLEHQEKIHYAMPARVMLMDALNYEKQLRALRRKHKEEKDLQTGDEYLSGIARTDRIKPVVTIVLYYGKKLWDGALDLYGILDFDDVPEKACSLTENYRINLIDVRRFSDWELFQTDLKEIFGFIRYSEDQKLLKEYLEMNRQNFSDMEEDAFDFLGEVTGMHKLQKIKIEMKKKGEKLDMCTAIDEMMKASKREGMSMGIERGKQQGMKEYLCSAVKKKLEKGQTEREMADALEVDTATIRKVIRELAQQPA